MKRNLSIVLALGAAFLLAPACSKEKQADSQSEVKAKTTETPDGDKKTAPDLAGVKQAVVPQAGAVEVLSQMPGDIEVVVSFSMPSLRSSPLWKQVGPAALAAASKELGMVQEACGFNPLEKLESVYVGLNTSREDEPVLVVTGFQREELSKCISAVAAKDGKKVTLTQEGAFTIVSSETKDANMSVAWTGPSTMIMVPGKGDKAFLQGLLDGTDSLKSNEAFVAAASKANQGAPIWFAAAFAEGSPAARGLGQMGSTPSGLYGSLGFATGLDLEIGVTFADQATANTTLDKLRPLLGLAKSQLGANAALLDKLKLATLGADMVMSLSLSLADLEKLQAMAGPMMGSVGN